MLRTLFLKMIEIIYRNIFLSVYTWVWASSLHAMILHPWRRTCWCVLRAVLEEFKPYCRSFLAILVVDLMPLVNGTSQWSKDTESHKLWILLSSIIVHRKQSIPATDAHFDKVRRVCFASQGKCSLSRRLCWLCWKQRLRISASCVLLFANVDHDEKICF